MKYLCQIWFDTEASKLVPQQEWDVLTDECIVSDDNWRDRGVLVTALALRAPESATTLRLKSGKVTATDGPFAEIKEHLGGFVVIEAADMEQAREVVATFPILKYASVEIRPGYSIKDGR
ncbi:hypothetical protein ASE04_16765 [Rhizobium sp. Root708]|uniref:YciI family protein n=1 Tax=Rhizobium sp. Root708 TaxID=1736592 RepID=UPI0006F271F4|nr:YciI family protein [Rhizobium sp. Root708]KRB50213.1 hypothetical protein ASE04_16765 [Rhizobium sp. Root708]